LHSNPNSWNTFSNLLYVDQPIGTGFSHSSIGDLVTNEDEVAENMAQFMIKFLEKYP
jgi:carboxypeptidase C (cathepsin A)